MCDEIAIHKVDRACALIGGQSNALPKEKQKDVAAASEHRSEYLSLPLVRSEPPHFLPRTATAMIEQNGGKMTRALRAPQECAKRNSPAVHHDKFKPGDGLTLGSRGESSQESQRHDCKRTHH
jgi:hypothetical protein